MRDAGSATGRQTALVITRIYDAPVSLVWQAWTDPALLTRWWGPKVFTVPVCRMDFRVGGKYLFCMRSPDGVDYWSTGVYREIVPQSRIVFTDCFADEKGNVVPAAHYDIPGEFPLEMVATLTFEEVGGKTVMNLRHDGMPVGDMNSMASQGWNESFDKLGRVVEGAADAEETQGKTSFRVLDDTPEVEMRRTFDAPREAVFRAYTDPEAIPRWWGPRWLKTTVEQMEVTPGGKWRFVQEDAAGVRYAFHGEYREVRLPERIVSTFEYEGAPGQVIVETVTFTEEGGRTMLIARSVFPSFEARDGMARHGMETGATESMDRLADVLLPEEGPASGDPSEREIFLSRIIDAPRDLVFQLWTDPDHLARWWGPIGFRTSTHAIDVRTGGEWTFVMHGPDGRNYDNHMKYIEVHRPERIVYDHVSTPPFRSTITFDDFAGRTRLTVRMVFATARERNRTIRVFGAVDGLHQTISRLAHQARIQASQKKSGSPR